MIDRFVFVRLKKEYVPERDAIAAYSTEILNGIPGILKAEVGTPADDHAEAAWDLSIRVRLDSLGDVEPYRAHPNHRRYVDEYLEPRWEVVKAWNFQV